MSMTNKMTIYIIIVWKRLLTDCIFIAGRLESSPQGELVTSIIRTCCPRVLTSSKKQGMNIFSLGDFIERLQANEPKKSIRRRFHFLGTFLFLFTYFLCHCNWVKGLPELEKCHTPAKYLARNSNTTLSMIFRK